MTELFGRTALVTGGGSGLGRGLATRLAAAGAHLIVADISEARAREAADEIAATGGEALGLACDVSDRAAVRAARAQGLVRFAPVSLLFANAGVTALKPLVEMAPADIDWFLGVDLMGALHCLEAFLPDMIGARSGHVVATASVAGLIPALLPQHAPYAAAKAGLIGLMLNLRQELATAGVGCTVICPDGVASRIAESGANRPERFGGPSADEIVPPAGVDPAAMRFRPPEEAAEMVLRGVRANRPMVLTDAARKPLSEQTYVELVLQAFDDAAAFDREREIAPDYG